MWKEGELTVCCSEQVVLKGYRPTNIEEIRIFFLHTKPLIIIVNTVHTAISIFKPFQTFVLKPLPVIIF